jgi:large subunit ribosomal protein L21
MSYAIITVGGKQYVVHEGEKLLVDRVATEPGKTFTPDVLFLGGEGKAELKPSTVVTVKVVDHVLGEKIRIGKYKKRTGYRRHNGFRARLTQIEIESIAAKKAAAAKKAEAEATEAVATEAVATEATAEEKPAKPKAEAKPAAAKKPAAKKPPADKPSAKKEASE